MPFYGSEKKDQRSFANLDWNDIKWRKFCKLKISMYQLFIFYVWAIKRYFAFIEILGFVIKILSIAQKPTTKN